MLDKWIENKDAAPRERLIAQEEDWHRVAVDNITHEFFMEDFDNLKDAEERCEEYN